jgi:TrmH family RNA methyltransferase
MSTEPMRQITSDANPAYRRWLKLATQPRAVREFARTLAEGMHVAQAALAANIRIEGLLVRRGAKGEGVAALVDLIARRGANAFELPPVLFDRLSPVQASVGVMLEIAIPQPRSGTGITEDLVYLDGIQDPGNAGALLRVAAAAGVRWALAAAGTAALWAPRTLRAGQGAHFALNLIEGVQAEAAADGFGGRWIAAAAHDAEPLWAAELPATAVGWVFGAEGFGISEAMLARCRQRVRIPLAAGIESLNVAAAAAICLFERRRRTDAAQ